MTDVRYMPFNPLGNSVLCHSLDASLSIQFSSNARRIALVDREFLLPLSLFLSPSISPEHFNFWPSPIPNRSKFINIKSKIVRTMVIHFHSVHRAHQMKMDLYSRSQLCEYDAIIHGIDKQYRCGVYDVWCVWCVLIAAWHSHKSHCVSYGVCSSSACRINLSKVEKNERIMYGNTMQEIRRCVLLFGEEKIFDWLWVVKLCIKHVDMWHQIDKLSFVRIHADAARRPPPRVWHCSSCWFHWPTQFMPM